MQNSNAYSVPSTATGGSALLVAGNARARGTEKLHIASAPRGDRPLLFVASYDDGLVVHDAGDLSVRGVLATGGVPSDVAVDRSGRVAATDTQGSDLTIFELDAVERRDGRRGARAGDDVAFDPTTRAIFVTDRECNGSRRAHPRRPGTRSRASSPAIRPKVWPIDEQRRIVYVANANDGTIAFVDARHDARSVGRFPAVARVFSLALSPDGNRLYAISQSSGRFTFCAVLARAIAIALRGAAPRIVARSASLDFPLGIALDARTQTLFVSDEERHEIDVLDARTLRRKHAPLRPARFPGS